MTTLNIPKVLVNTTTSKLWIVENFSCQGSDILHQLVSLPLEIEPPIIIMGRECRQRRNVGFFSNESIGYKYSGQMMKSKSLDSVPLLKTLIFDVNKCLGTNFNGILVNQYMNGEHYIGAHSDDEKGLDKGGKNIVASIAYGATRKFRIRNKQTREIVLDHDHLSGSLLVMEGNFQKEFTHEIPIQKKIKDMRISLTFRNHVL